MNIRTDFIYPQIPNRDFDWCSVDDDTYDGGGPIGYGPTKEAAIAALIEMVGEQ